MRILLAQKLSYSQSFTGAGRLARSFLESLAERNHQCRAIAFVNSPNDISKDFTFPANIKKTPIIEPSATVSKRVFVDKGVEVYEYSRGAQLHEHLKEHIHKFDPTWVIVSEDPTFLLLATAMETAANRTIYWCQSQATLPFGPEAFAADRLKKQLLEETAGILASSHYLHDYIKRWSKLDSFVVKVSVFGKPPFPELGSIRNPYVTLINPSNIKGLPIFLTLAQRFRDIQFAVVPTWATTAFDRQACESLPNVSILRPSENIDEILSQTRLLLVPSLWGEAFGLVVVEAMLRGIPVLTSNVGGLPEAKLGTDFILPVRKIVNYEDRRDENGIQIPIISEQNVDPWESAMRKILFDESYYRRISLQSKTAAINFTEGLSIVSTEEYLENLLQRRKEKPPSFAGRPTKDLSNILDRIPKEKLELLAAYLRKNR